MKKINEKINQDLVNKIKEIVKDGSVKQSQIARSIAISPTQLSQYLGGYYAGAIDELEKKLSDFLRNLEIKDVESINELKIVETTDMKDMLKNLLIPAIKGKELATVYGEAGCGKTTAIKEFIKNHPEAILIEAIPGMQLSHILKAICSKAKIDEARNNVDMILNISKAFESRDVLLIVDEAENLTSKTLEAIRRIWDFSRTPTILVGTYSLIDNLRGRHGELKQLYSRIGGSYRFEGLDEKDWELIFKEFATDIKKYTSNLRTATNIYKRAEILAQSYNEKINKEFIELASAMVILG